MCHTCQAAGAAQPLPDQAGAVLQRPLSRRVVLQTLAVAAGTLATGQAVQAKPVKLPAPGPRDTCPVCGMFVAPYPYWVATVLWRDGKAVHFDGAKDFFKYLQDLKKYEPGRALAEINAMGVTDYYATGRIDAAQAYYVIGSDVLGPMGHELVPHDTQAEAKEFMADHSGKRVLRFAEVTQAMLLGLDGGKF
jgi:copper chaperone NosL